MDGWVFEWLPQQPSPNESSIDEADRIVDAQSGSEERVPSRVAAGTHYALSNTSNIFLGVWARHAHHAIE